MDRFTTSDGKIVGFEGDMDKLADALLQLSKYEDTGLLPEEVAELQKKVERQDADIDILLKSFSELLNKRNATEKLRIQCDNFLLKSDIDFLNAEAKRDKEEIKRLQDKITAAADLLRETRREDASEPDPDVTRCEDATVQDPDAKLAPKKKQKIAWEAD